jgi:DNA-binding transcriptional LysR family regulator
LHLEERTPERVWEMLAKGRLSVAFTRPVPTSDAAGLRTHLLRNEKLGVVIPRNHPWADHESVSWRAVAHEPLIILARREGVSLHEEVLIGCRRAGFTPRIAYTPSLIGTVLSYVEAGAGIGIVPECVTTMDSPLRFVRLKPARSIQLVLAWQENDDDPAVQRFRELVLEWQLLGKLWRQ